MNEGGVDENKTDDNEDIYGDIGDFYFDRELTKLENSNKAYLDNISCLTEKIKQLSERNLELQNMNEVLLVNISVLLKTAKAEIQRKQLVINEFRKKIQNINTYQGGNKNSEKCETCGHIELSDHCKIKKTESNKQYVDVYKSFSKGECHIYNKITSYSDKQRSHSENKCDESSNYRKKNNSEGSRERSVGRHSSRPSEQHTRHKHNKYSCESSSQHLHRRRSSDRRYRRRHSEEKSNGRDYPSSSSGRRTTFFTSKDEVFCEKKEEQRKYKKEKFSSLKDYSTKSELPCKTESEDVGKRIVKETSTVFDEKKLKTENSYFDDHQIGQPVEGNVLPEGNCDIRIISSPVFSRKKNNLNESQMEDKIDLFPRQSVLADLYEDPEKSKKYRFQDSLANCQDTFAATEKCLEKSSDSSEIRSWDLPILKKEPKVEKKNLTLYSRRMEVRLRQLKEEEEAATKSQNKEEKLKTTQSGEKSIIEKPQKNNSTGFVERDVIHMTDEKEEGEITIEDENLETIEEKFKTNENKCEDSETKKILGSNDGPPVTTFDFSEKTGQQNHEKAVDSGDIAERNTNLLVKTEMCKTPEKSIGGVGLIKKLLQMQNFQRPQEIKEFSPLKNNYKLSKISPPKEAVTKQHILEYYNLRPSAQQLINDDPESFDFSLALPDTPGKDFSDWCSTPKNTEKFFQIRKDGLNDKPNLFFEEKENEKLEKNLAEVTGNTSILTKSEDLGKVSRNLEETLKSERKTTWSSGLKNKLVKTCREQVPDVTKDYIKQCVNTDDTVELAENTVSETKNRSCNSSTQNDSADKLEKLKHIRESVKTRKGKRAVTGKSKFKNSLRPNRKRSAVSSDEEDGGCKRTMPKRKRTTEKQSNLKKVFKRRKSKKNEQGGEQEVNRGKVKPEPVGAQRAQTLFESVCISSNLSKNNETTNTSLNDLSLFNFNDSRLRLDVSKTDANKPPNKAKMDVLSSVSDDPAEVEESDMDYTSSGEYSDSGASALVDLL